MSLFSQLKESNCVLDKANNNNIETPEKDESMVPVHVEIAKVDETLMEHMENHEDEGAESKELGHDSFAEEEEEEEVCQHQSEVVFLFLVKMKTLAILLLLYLLCLKMCIV